MFSPLDHSLTSSQHIGLNSTQMPSPTSSLSPLHRSWIWTRMAQSPPRSSRRRWSSKRTTPRKSHLSFTFPPVVLCHRWQLKNCAGAKLINLFIDPSSSLPPPQRGNQLPADVLWLQPWWQDWLRGVHRALPQPSQRNRLQLGCVVDQPVRTHAQWPPPCQIPWGNQSVHNFHSLSFP